MSTPAKWDVFICYSRRNKNWLPKLRDILKEYRYFIDESDIETSQEWDPRIDEAISNSKVAICLASRPFFKSDYIRDHELPRIERRLIQDNITVITIRISGCEDGLKESFLAKIQYFNTDDYFDDPDDLDKFRDKLKLAVHKGVNPSPQVLPQILVSNLPAKPKWFVGHEKEKDKLKQHILTRQGLISITGDPRTGRRTLAKQVAYELLENGDLPGGAIWIDCHKIEDEKALINAVSEILLKSRAPADLYDCQQILEDEFSKKRCLIVLANTENPRADFFEHWAKKIPSPSVVIDVTASIARPEDALNIHLKGLDDKDAEALFVTVASETLRKEKPFSKHAEFVCIRKICSVTRNNPLLIEIYANKRGQGLFLDDILTLAHSNRGTDTLTIWKSELEPLFSALEEAHRDAFLKLCRLPDGVGRELVREITGIEPLEIGPALRKQFLWDMGDRRYLIDPSVRTFAETKLMRPVAEVDSEVALAFARLATTKAALIEKSLVRDRQTLDEAVEWFSSEWENLNYCAGVAEHIGDEETVCRLADSILQFMIRRGRYDDCLKLYEKALSLRDKDDPGRAKTLNDMAVCLQFKSKFDDARLHIQESIKLRQELINKSESSAEQCELMFRLAQSWNTCGFINLLDKNSGLKRFIDVTKAFETAENICKQASEIAITLAMRTEIEIERSQTLSNLGRCFTEFGHEVLDPDERKAHFDKALSVFSDSISIKRPGDEREGQTYSRRGQLRLEQNQLPLAENDFNNAISILEVAQNTFELGIAYLGRGRVLAMKVCPDIEGAINDFKRSEELFAELHDPKNQFDTLMELATIEKKRGNLAEAEAYATKAYDIADKASLVHERLKAERFLENLQS